MLRLSPARTAVGSAAAWLNGSALISLSRRIFQPSTLTPTSGSGSQSRPSVAAFDFSGRRSGLPTVTAATAVEQSFRLAPGSGVPPGQRTGSRVVALVVDCDSAPDSAGPGARKPAE